MSRRTILIAIGSLAVVAVVVIGLAQSSEVTKSSDSTTTLSAAEVQAKVAGAPPQIAALHAKADQLIPGTPASVQQQIKRLKGTPVVVNMWGSWCGPCRVEMPLMQGANAKYGTKVAFLGVDSADNNDNAMAFLRQVPVGYPSYEDGDGTIVQKLAPGAAGLPTTVMYDAQGRQQIHQGPYQEQADLDKDIERYALGQSSR